jgi:hypothetical protein
VRLDPAQVGGNEHVGDDRGVVRRDADLGQHVGDERLQLRLGSEAVLGGDGAGHISMSIPGGERRPVGPSSDPVPWPAAMSP